MISTPSEYYHTARFFAQNIRLEFRDRVLVVAASAARSAAEAATMNINSKFQIRSLAGERKNLVRESWYNTIVTEVY